MPSETKRVEPLEVEPEVLPPEDDGHEGPTLGKRVEHAFGPIVAGMIIDTVDIATFGSFGIMLGPLIGGTAAFWLCSINDLPIWQRVLWSVVAGIYCAFPRTEFIPLATLIGAGSRFFNPPER